MDGLELASGEDATIHKKLTTGQCPARPEARKQHTGTAMSKHRAPSTLLTCRLRPEFRSRKVTTCDSAGPAPIVKSPSCHSLPLQHAPHHSRRHPGAGGDEPPRRGGRRPAAPRAPGRPALRAAAGPGWPPAGSCCASQDIDIADAAPNQLHYSLVKTSACWSCGSTETTRVPMQYGAPNGGGHWLFTAAGHCSIQFFP